MTKLRTNATAGISLAREQDRTEGGNENPLRCADRLSWTEFMLQSVGKNNPGLNQYFYLVGGNGKE